MSEQSKIQEILDIISNWAVDNKLEVPSDASLTFSDAGFDSLHSTELSFFLEDKLGIPVDETVIWEKATFDSLAKYLAEKSGALKPDAAQSPAGDERPIAKGGDW